VSGNRPAALEQEVAKLTEEISNCYEELALLHSLTDRLRPFTDTDRVARTVLEAVADALRARYAFLLLGDGTGRAEGMKRFAWVGFSDRSGERGAHGEGRAWPVYDGITREALRTGRAMIVNDVRADPRFRPDPIPLTSLLTVPLRGHGPGGESVLGALNVANRLDGQGFTSGDLKLVATVAGLAAAALENALLVADLQRTNSELEQANRKIVEPQAAMVRAEKLSSLGRMAAGVAHELRNPIAVILGRVQVAQRKLRLGVVSGDDLERTLTSIEESSERASRIIQGLLAYSRQQPSEKGRVDVRELVPQALALVQPQIKLGGVEVRTEIAPDLPPIHGNRDQLLQVLINLVMNAVAAMRANGTLAIHAAMMPERGVRIAVADTGSGIPAEHLSEIFDPFFTTKPEGEGTGLGLSIVHGIVESHGGTIQVESEVGKGTTFSLNFPPLDDGLS
jgi:signal transduction histidine kinase